MSRIVLASSNPGKLAEFNALLADSGLSVEPQSAYDVSDVEETGLTFVENALLKARHAARLSGLPALADDSGLCVEHLRGAPGLYSARYSGKHGDNAANNAKLLHEMKDVPAEKRGAFFICVLVLVQHADDPAPLIAEGRWHGRVLTETRGTHGFGYDPLFLPDDETVSAAELPPGLKNRISHRGRALTELRQRLAAPHV
ncbi:RdgB/HAM1 family non-canonical purine NTP pyrophosphatase [Dyella solisilvae]|uniref:dITP/XTP pyrophosphatase n=1 Tax=Dyella solisilvae TaxID=1920168 RepID=A0A370K785_9GAMM|nr:RdgB/HAM1 family non-canonical purine NTP pyrophosphatase [Dyella solisilvae]RDI98482.1 RdgB/HAM1 family non-canonical purine NTP pyrophosphatase [Dyella solisilvae]